MYLGIDIGGTDLKGVLISADFKIIAEKICPSHVGLGIEQGLAKLVEFIDSFAKDHTIESIGIGCAGSIDSDAGIVRSAPNFKEWNQVLLTQRVESVFKIPTFLENDANCAAYTEWKLGKAKGCKNLVLLTFGTGIGGGLILNNALFHGSTGTAGELGHLSIVSDGIPCPCGHTGCFERYCAGAGLREKLGPGVSVEQAFSNPEKFSHIILPFKQHLKIALTSIANIFDPDWILLGGGMSPGFKPFLEDLKTHLQLQAYTAIRSHVQLDIAQFGNWSGSLGAACIARDYGRKINMPYEIKTQ